MIIDLSLTVAAYLIGARSAAFLICRLLGRPEPRTQGSGNPGATNVLRFGGKKAAALVLIGDSAKGLAPVLLAKWMQVDDNVLAAVGLAAFLGHLYPLFFGFHGGKGVATAFGVLYCTAWPVAVAAAASWLMVAKIFRSSSLAALIAAILAPLFLWLHHQSQSIRIMIGVMSLLLLWRHRGNIPRLISGAEGRIGRYIYCARCR